MNNGSAAESGFPEPPRTITAEPVHTEIAPVRAESGDGGESAPAVRRRVVGSSVGEEAGVARASTSPYDHLVTCPGPGLSGAGRDRCGRERAPGTARRVERCAVAAGEHGHRGVEAPAPDEHLPTGPHDRRTLSAAESGRWASSTIARRRDPRQSRRRFPCRALRWWKRLRTTRPRSARAKPRSTNCTPRALRRCRANMQWTRLRRIASPDAPPCIRGASPVGTDRVCLDGNNAARSSRVIIACRFRSAEVASLCTHWNGQIGHGL